MSDLSAVLPALTARAGGVCELCEAAEDLAPWGVGPGEVTSEAQAVLACATCRAQLEADAALDATHWFCLQGSAWSAVPAVQVIAFRLLHRLSDAWAVDLRDQLYLDDETLAWARSGLAEEMDTVVPTLDSHGTALADGDTVVLVQDLNVKGGGFTAKRGTVVKGIRLTDDPGNVEGRIQKMTIVLKTQYLKRVSA